MSAEGPEDPEGADGPEGPEEEGVSAQLAPLSLDDLNRSAGLLMRVERKYLVDRNLLHLMLNDHRDRLAMLDIDGRRSFEYSSLYFDTPDVELHRAAATNRRRGVKVRTRVYEDTRTAMLEVKAKDGRGRTLKHRQPHAIDRGHELGEAGAAFVDELTNAPGFASSLVPTLTTRYWRSTLVDQISRSRATMDVSLSCTHVDGRSIRFDQIVVETKSDLVPSALDRWMWLHGVRPERFSKYCTSLVLLEPGLPDNKWHRTITRHFTGHVTT